MRRMVATRMSFRRNAHLMLNNPWALVQYQSRASTTESPGGRTPPRRSDGVDHIRILAWFKSRSQLGVAGVDARRATPPDPRPLRSGLAGDCQLDPSHPALVTRGIVIWNHAKILAR